MRPAMKKNQLPVLGLTLALLLTACTAPGQVEPTPDPTHISEVNLGALVTDRYHLEYDSPEYCRLDITLPLFSEELPDIVVLNAQIEEDWGLFLNTAPYELQYVEYGFAYPMVCIDYEEYRFGDVLELVVRYEAYSLYGSGPAAFNSVYCYDMEQKSPSSLSELMEQLEITEEDVINAYMKTYGIGEEERDLISFQQDLDRFFFVGEDGTIQIEYNQ